jgi:xylulokinase
LSVVLCCDLGGTSFRAALVGADGRMLALRVAPEPPTGGGPEADPRHWWRLFARALEELAADDPAAFGRIAAVAVSAFTRSQVFLDAAGGVARPVMLWNDAGAGEDLPDLLGHCPPDHPETANLNAFHPLARLFRLARREPDSAARIRAVVDPKDFLNFRLTGVLASDSVSLARLAASAAPGPAGGSLFEAAGLDAGILPPLLAPTDVVGRVRQGLPGVLARLAGVPVLAMANDTWASVVGLGAMRPGLAYNLSGTTEVFGIVTDEPAGAVGLLTVAWGEGLIQIGGPSQTGADALAWLAGLLHPGGAQAATTAATVEALLAGARHPQPLIFLPYLQGERVPYWDPGLRGAFIGLSRGHTATDLACAVMQGVACLNRVVLERAEAAAGMRVSQIRFGGGGAANAEWCRIKADMLGRPVLVPEGGEHGLIGAAVVAFAALGRFADLAAAQAALVRPGRRYDPDPARREASQRLFVLFRQAEGALAPISRALAGWSS